MTPNDKPVRPPQPVPEPDRERDQDIADLRALGWTLERIGRAMGITRQRVGAILKRLDRERMGVKP